MKKFRAKGPSPAHPALPHDEADRLAVTRTGRESSLRALGGSANGSRYALLVQFLAGCLVYANNLSGEFILNDSLAIVDNQQIHSLFPLEQLLKPAPDTPLSARPVAALPALAWCKGAAGLSLACGSFSSLLPHRALSRFLRK